MDLTQVYYVSMITTINIMVVICVILWPKYNWWILDYRRQNSYMLFDIHSYSTLWFYEHVLKFMAAL